MSKLRHCEVDGRRGYETSKSRNLEIQTFPSFENKKLRTSSSEVATVLKFEDLKDSEFQSFEASKLASFEAPACEPSRFRN